MQWFCLGRKCRAIGKRGTYETVQLGNHVDAPFRAYVFYPGKPRERLDDYKTCDAAKQRCEIDDTQTGKSK